MFYQLYDVKLLHIILLISQRYNLFGFNFFCLLHYNAVKMVHGFAIGNCLTNPAIQYKAYTDYALDMGVINKIDYDRINKLVPVCELAIKLCGNFASERASFFL